MTLMRENDVDANAHSGTQYTLAVNSVFQGALDPANDKDWIRVELTAGKTYLIRLTGVDAAHLNIFDAEENFVFGREFTEGPDLPVLLSFNPPDTGTYYLSVNSGNDDFSTDYEISIVVDRTPIGGTFDEIADYMINGYWEDNYGDGRRAFDVAPGGALTVDITALTVRGQLMARWALESWTNVTGIRFEFVEDENAHILFDDYYVDATGITYVSASDGIIHSSEVVIPEATLRYYGTSVGSFTFYIYVHEIGHALGLGHPGSYEGEVNFGIDNIFLNDSLQSTVMSYFDQGENTYINASMAFPVTPMATDIVAVHELYGAPTDVRVGDTVYGYNSNVDGLLGEFFRLWTGDSAHYFSFDVDVGPRSAPAFVDLDGDGDVDLVVVSESGEFISYIENTGTALNPRFMQRIGAANPLDGFIGGYNGTPALIDLDGDADPDLVVVAENGTIYFYENTGTATSPGFTRRTGAASPLDGVDLESYSTATFTDLDGDGDPDLIVGKRFGTVDYYENTGTVTSPDFTQRTGATNPFNAVDAGTVIAPIIVDLDADGDPDLVVVVENGVILYFENTGTVTRPGFTERTGTANPVEGVYTGFYGALSFADLDGDGDPDLIATTASSTVDYYENTGVPTHPEFAATLLDTGATLSLLNNSFSSEIDVGPRSAPAFADLDSDGDFDLVVVSESGNYIFYIENTGTAINPRFTQRIDAGNPLDGFIGGYNGTPALADLDGDADPDLVVVAENGTIYFYENTGTATSPGFTRRTGAASPLDGVDLESYSTATFTDLDGDGDPDLIVGKRFGTVDYYENTGTVTSPDFTQRTGATNPFNAVDAGTVIAPVIVDLDADGDPDLVVVVENGVILYFENTGTVTRPGFTERTGTANPVEGVNTGFYGALSFADLDGDGDPDLIATTASSTVDYYENTGTLARPDYSQTSGGDFLSTTLTLYDNGGTDTLDLRTDAFDQRIDLRPEGISDVYGLIGNLVIARDTLIENVIAGSGKDQIIGNEAANRLDGAQGNDLLNGGAGADALKGGGGEDVASYSYSDAGVVVRLHSAKARGGHAAGDTFIGMETVEYLDSEGEIREVQVPDIEHLVGSAHNDTLAGDIRGNRLEGAAGDDSLYGGPDGGNDWLSGGTGDDKLYGGKGDDTLEGGSGADMLNGGNGADIYLFAAGHGDDTILDFTDNEDRIELSEFGLSGFDDLTLSSDSNGVTIDLSASGGGTILLQGFDLDNLDAGDFLF